MSLITRCPACGTMFKVVPDQLRISEGWVRCGHCAEIFDAGASLQEPLPEELLAQPGPEPVVAPAAVAPQPSAPSASAPAPIAASAPAEAVDSIDAPPLYPSFPSEVRDSELERPSRLDEEEEEEPDLDGVSFVRHARRKAFWSRPLVRAMLALVFLLLAGVLGLQFAVHERNRLAAMEPALRPWLERLCEPLQCEVGPLRQIDSVAIDSSSFSKLRGDSYRLNFTLKNQAPTDVAMPSIELTLTDTQDQAVVRRILAPHDVGATAVIPATSEWSGSVAMSVASGTAGGRIAGYRMLAFYP